MRLLILLLATIASAIADTRVAEVGGWWLLVPADTKMARKVGPDFTVTYFEFASAKGGIGIYEGGWPSRFAVKAKGVKEMKDVVCGQPTKWSVWADPAPGPESVHAETIVRARSIRPPGSSQTFDVVFHIFLNAPDQLTRVELQKIARSLTNERPADFAELTEEHPRLTDVPKFPPDQHAGVRAVIAALKDASLYPDEYGAKVSTEGGKLSFWLIHQSHKADPGSRGDSCGQCRTIEYDRATGDVSRLLGIR